MKSAGLVGKNNKSLLILDLNGVLGYMTKETTKYGATGVYAQQIMRAVPSYKDANLSIYSRPNLTEFIFNFLVQKKRIYDVGVWSSAGFDDTKIMVEKLFGRYYTQ